MSVRVTGYPIVSQTTLVDFMNRFLATQEGQATAEQFAATGIQAYFIANPIEDDIAADVAAYIAANPPASGQNATAAQVQQAVDAYLVAYPPQEGPVGPAGQSITQAQLASAVAAYLIANPPQQGATGPAGQNATAEQVAQAVAAYITANPLTSAINSAVAAFFASNPSMFKGGKGDNGTVFLTGQGAPANALGNVGDYYIDTANDRLYGPKAATGTIWPSLVPLGDRYVGTATIAQTAAIAISAGVRIVNATVTPASGMPSVAAGDDVVLVPATIPAGYMIQPTCRATATNTIPVTLTAPLLAIGGNYSFQVAVYVKTRLS